MPRRTGPGLVTAAAAVLLSAAAAAGGDPSYTAEVTVPTGGGVDIAPGSRVDIFAGVPTGRKVHVFTLLADVPVHGTGWRAGGPVTASLAVTSKQAEVLALARERGCRTEARVRWPGTDAPAHDLDRVVAFLRDLPVPAREVAPPPRAAVAPLPLPPGTALVTLRVPNEYDGFVAPGSRADVLGTVRVGEKVRVVLLLTDIPVHTVDTPDPDRFPENVTVGLVLTPKQAEVLALARERGCRTEFVLRNPDRPVPDHDLDAVVGVLRDLPHDLVAPAPRPVVR
ncbi:MAG: hypothetical protein C0501_20055 [Isosphaera sp.]|nr:hypothetical protein [Isosphaera sp.]